MLMINVFLPLPAPVIPVCGRQQSARRRLLASQLSRDSAERGLLTFTVVAEPDDSEDDEAECTDVG